MPRKERERRYIAEYMKTYFPQGDWQLNVELGRVPSDYVTRMGYSKAAALIRPTRPRVDAVSWTHDAYYLIEAKLRDIKAGIGDLIYYKNEAMQTLDMPYYTGQPITCRLVVPWMIDWMQKAAADNDIEVQVFKPDWIDDYVRERQNYFTAEYRAERAEKMRLRNILGVE